MEILKILGVMTLMSFCLHLIGYFFHVFLIDNFCYFFRRNPDDVRLAKLKFLPSSEQVILNVLLTPFIVSFASLAIMTYVYRAIFDVESFNNE